VSTPLLRDRDGGVHGVPTGGDGVPAGLEVRTAPEQTAAVTEEDVVART
jgi:hypothetical protein